jgi:uncharacterized cupin superfamily protein
MPKIDPDQVQISQGSSYPAPFDEPCRGRRTQRLSAAAGLTQFGVNMTTLAPGSWASQRHWHAHEDEFVYVVAGELVLVEDAGETLLGPGDSAAWRGGVRDGHHLQNRSDADATFIVVGSRIDDDHGEYPDIDLAFGPGRYSGARGGTYRHKDGTPY